MRVPSPLRPLSAQIRGLGSAAGVQQPGWFNRMLLTNEYNLPRLPVPRLDETVQRYLESVRPLVSTKDWEAHKELAKSFEVTEGRQLQELLLKRELKQAMGRAYPFSYIEQDWDKMYLGGRYQNPINVNPSYGLVDETDGNLQGMISRSAAFVRSMVKWWTKVKNSDLEQDKDQCMSGFARQYGTARIPNKGCDVLTSHPRATHIVVMTENNYFRLDVLSPDGKQLLTQRQLEAQLDFILNTSSQGDHDDVDVSTLTAEKRDTWAQIREDLVAHHPVNAETLQVIDSALFVLILEHRNPSDMSQRTELSLHGQGCYRWFDKLQVMVQPDGHLALNFEHSFSDGTIWNRWLHECWHDMRGSDSKYAPLENMPEFTNATKPKKLKWKLSNNLVDDVKKAERHFVDFCGNLNSEFLMYTNFAKSECKQWKLSPDGIAQMALQLAFYRTHGKIAPTYESCSTRLFHHGRTETIRSATPAAEAFVKSVETGANITTQRDLLVAAVNRHVKMATTAQKGLGVDRHLTALNSIANQHEITSDFLASSVRAKSTNFLISSSNVTMPFLQYFSFGAVVPHGYGVGYLLHNKSINVSLTNYKDSCTSDGGTMKMALESSLDTIKALADNSAP